MKFAPSFTTSDLFGRSKTRYDVVGGSGTVSETELISRDSKFPTTREAETFDSPITYKSSWPLSPKKKEDEVLTKFQPDGWKFGASLAASTAAITALINLAVGARISYLAGRDDPFSSQILIEMFHGDCSRASTINTWSHLAINVISTGLLAGSNFCMQCLVAPSRADVDRAHAKSLWLDIGLPSIRNLRHISSLRCCLWFLLALSSLPLHLLFNSAFFSSIATNDYIIAFANPGYLEGDFFNYTLPQSYYYVEPLADSAIALQQQYLVNASQFERLENAECVNAYAKDLITSRRSVIVVSNDRPALPSNGSIILLMYGSTGSRTSLLYPWICPVPVDSNPLIGQPQTYNYINEELCNVQVEEKTLDIINWHPSGITAEYCMSEKVQEQCGFYANIAIIWTVFACNVVKLVIMAYIVFSPVIDHPLMTIGDSVASFIVNPDVTTSDIGVVSKVTMKKLKKKDWRVLPTQQWGLTGRKSRWFNAASKRRWFVTIFYFITCLTALGVLLPLGLSRLDGNKSVSALYNRGLGAVLVETIIDGWDISEMGVDNAVVSSVLVANSPQLILSILYFAVNSLLTSMVSAQEWSRFSVRRSERHKPRALRTSNPIGDQRRTYFLQLPFRFAVPLIILSALLHWLISQSIFLAVISRYDSDGILENVFQIATCGFSPIGIIFLLIVGGCILLCLIGLSFISLDSSMPLVGSCSAAISAACHVNWLSGSEQSSAGQEQFRGLDKHQRLGEEARIEMIKRPLVWGRVLGDKKEFRGLGEDVSSRDKGQQHYGFVSATGVSWRDRVKVPAVFT